MHFTKPILTNFKKMGKVRIFHARIKQKKGIFMKNFLVLMFVLFSFVNGVFANENKVIPSETGIVLETLNLYEDENNTHSVNQVVTV